MTQEEINRLANYKTMATFNKVQVEDYFDLLVKEQEAYVPEPVVEEVKPKKSKKAKS